MYTGSAEAIALACCLDAGEIPGPRIYQLAANLLAAAGSRITEVRITRLAEGVFHAVAVVEAPGGAVEVDARPSDAVNLAVLSGAPIRVDAAILDDPVVDSHPEWEQYPARLADLAAEERQRRADSQARLRDHESPPSPNPDGAMNGEVAPCENGEPYTRSHSACGGNRVPLVPLAL